MPDNIDHILSKLPPEYNEELLPSIREEFLRSKKTIVVLDDDPTGTQTCYDVTVLTAWSVPLLSAELGKKPSILFILTNSRSLPEREAVQLTREIGRNLQLAVKESGRQIVPMSRSDSTLRGHFPAEVDALAQSLNIKDAVWILLPAFIEGGRYTIGDVHYIKEGQNLLPVSETPFANDAVFGYRNANLKQWVEEKSHGKIKASEVISLSIEDIRTGGPEEVYKKLVQCKPGTVCVVNACSFKDIEVVVAGLMKAEKSGRKFLFRTSATLVPISAGMTSGKVYTPQIEKSPYGSLVVVGSYVPKTSAQLEYLLAKGSHKPIEVNVSELLKTKEPSAYANSIINRINQWLTAGDDVVVYTSRQLEKGKNPESSLHINSLVSTLLVSIVKGLTVRPSFIIAKGGVTSSDIAAKGLSAEKALILGQVIPGVPVWRLEEKSKFPGITYVVFPGNVGDRSALADVCGKFTTR